MGRTRSLVHYGLPENQGETDSNPTDRRYFSTWAPSAGRLVKQVGWMPVSDS